MLRRNFNKFLFAVPFLNLLKPKSNIKSDYVPALLNNESLLNKKVIEKVMAKYHTNYIHIPKCVEYIDSPF